LVSIYPDHRSPLLLLLFFDSPATGRELLSAPCGSIGRALLSRRVPPYNLSRFDGFLEMVVVFLCAVSDDLSLGISVKPFADMVI